ncbi:MAG: hypothetical protein NW220_17725 [Leptolyngbyaceae cyanobacterium bins.349]|nr:hypothetical protein [Leptolyngbyaceae cyanobacterium bins.349]
MPQPPKTKRLSRLNYSPAHAEKVKQAQAELAQKIENPFASLMRKNFWLGLLMITLAIALALLSLVYIFLSQIYAIIVGSSIIWSGISSMLNGQPSFTYHAGSFNPLPLFQFNPGLGNVYFGWGVLLSVFIGWKKAQGKRLLLILALLFGLATFITGLMNLRGMQVDIGMRISGLFGFLLALLIGFSLVDTVLTAWKRQK